MTTVLYQVGLVLYYGNDATAANDKYPASVRLATGRLYCFEKKNVLPTKNFWTCLNFR